jgi:hypothetical protein
VLAAVQERRATGEPEWDWKRRVTMSDQSEPNKRFNFMLFSFLQSRLRIVDLTLKKKLLRNRFFK